MIYKISAEESGKTVKEILRYGVGLSLAFTKKLKFLENGIMLNGERVTVRCVVREGDILSLATEDDGIETLLSPTNIPFDCIYEDDSVILPSKPALMPTHPSRNHRGDTLADALAYKYKQEGVPLVFRAISRLDKDTSGVLLLAKDRISASRLSEAMKRGEISKQYIAILDGVLSEPSGVIETYIKREAESIIKRTVCVADEGGDKALTHYETLAENGTYSLVLASPITGRTHQLRVHFSYLGAPILGDGMYGRESDLISRHALHALSLEFPHPKSESKMRISAPLFEDMEGLVASMFGAEAIQKIHSLTQ